MSVGFYAGSFDPFTNGHLSVVKKASTIFDQVIIGIGSNPKKQPAYSKKDMKSAIEKVLKREKIYNATVVIYEGYTGKIAIANNATILIRGIRNFMDYAFEEDLATSNEKIFDLDTLYIRAGDFGYISSSVVKRRLELDKDVSSYVPTEILNLLL